MTIVDMTRNKFIVLHNSDLAYTRVASISIMSCMVVILVHYFPVSHDCCSEMCIILCDVTFLRDVDVSCICSCLLTA